MDSTRAAIAAARAGVVPFAPQIMRAAVRQLRHALLALTSGIVLALCIGAGCTVDEIFDTDDKPSGGVDCYQSFGSFKRGTKRAGKEPPSDQQWHHIVNQNPTNKKQFPDRLHCTDNLVAVPTKIHHKINGHYSSKQTWTRPKTVREVISAKAWAEQHDYGLRILREYGIEP